MQEVRHAPVSQREAILAHLKRGWRITPKEALDETQDQFEIILKQNYYLPYQGQSYDDNVDKTIQLIKALSP